RKTYPLPETMGTPTSSMGTCMSGTGQRGRTLVRFRVHRARKVPPDLKDRRAARESKARQGSPARRGSRACKAPSERPETRVPKDRRVRKESRESKAPKVLKDLKARKVHKDRKDPRDRKVLPERTRWPTVAQPSPTSFLKPHSSSPTEEAGTSSLSTP